MSRYLAAIATRPTRTAPAEARRLFTQQELSEVLGMSHQAVQQAEQRAIKKLRLAWDLWESIGWDTRRQHEINGRLP